MHPSRSSTGTGSGELLDHTDAVADDGGATQAANSMEFRRISEEFGARPPPLRVLLLLSSLHGGGAERVAVQLLDGFDPARFDGQR